MPDEKTIVAVNSDGTIRIWDLDALSLDEFPGKKLIEPLPDWLEKSNYGLIVDDKKADKLIKKDP